MTVDASEFQELADWLTMKVAGYLNVPSDTIDVDTPLADCGIDSVLAKRLCVDLECEKGFAAETTIGKVVDSLIDRLYDQLRGGLG